MNSFITYQYKVLEQWETVKMSKIYDINNYTKQFIFIDGPPFCSGKLHIGHMSISAIKSTLLTYKAMMGYKCKNKLGYDCHGLPIESIVNNFSLNSSIPRYFFYPLSLLLFQLPSWQGKLPLFPECVYRHQPYEGIRLRFSPVAYHLHFRGRFSQFHQLNK